MSVAIRFQSRLSATVGAAVMLSMTLPFLSACDKERAATVQSEAQPSAGPGGSASPSPSDNQTPDGGTKLPSRTLPITYEGRDRNSVCRLVLHSESYVNGSETKENYRAIVSTSYEHDGESAGMVEIAFATINGTPVLQWKNPQDGEELRISLGATETTLNNPSGFTLKWLHGDHLHSNKCLGLKEAATP